SRRRRPGFQRRDHRDPPRPRPLPREPGLWSSRAGGPGRHAGPDLSAGRRRRGLRVRARPVRPSMAAATLILAVSSLISAALAALAGGPLTPPPAGAEVALRALLLRLDAGIGAPLLRAMDHVGTWRVLLPASFLLFALSRTARARWRIWAVALLAAPAAEQF